MSIEVRAQNTISMTSVKAIKDATDRSAQLLAEMEQYAEDAGTTLTGIYQDAEDAKAGAISAKESADTALVNLSQVQNVLEVVEWVALHGEYSKTTDVAINPNKTYYTVTATAVTTPTDEDISTYYELNNGSYVKTTDTTVVSGKTYYTVTGVPVASPAVADIGTYYELAINEAMANYIMTHLALTNDGLYVTSDASAYKLLLASDGMYIKAPNGETVNQSTANGNVIRATNGTVIAHLGYGLGNDEHGTTSLSPYYTFGRRMSGQDIGNLSVAEGDATVASKFCSHAEGTNTFATAQCAHAEGMSTQAGGECSHTEGRATSASGNSAHAQNIGTRASGDAQTAIGMWNKYYYTDIAFVIGNGTADDARSDALTVDWDGIISARDKSGNFDTIFNLIYPVGSYYETSDTTFDPNVSWGGTWEKVESGRFLQATTDTNSVGNTVSAGLPNITGSVQPAHGKSVWVETVGGSGAFYNYNYATNCGVLSYSSTAGGNNSIAFDASRSNSIYGNSTTVQPPSILVFIWHRTA